MFTTRTVHFESVKLRQSVSYVCTRCKKARSKVAFVENTINPFNRNADGLPKTRDEVAADVRHKHANLVAEIRAGITCNKCKDDIVAERRLAALEAPIERGGQG